MLLHLNIQNFILIENISVDFKPNLCVITGETGSGKSIILKALGIALGAKTNAKVIRNQESPAIISAEFQISDTLSSYLFEHGLTNTEEPNTLILRRVLYTNGKTKCYVNDNPCSLSIVDFLASKLVETSNQHDQRGLFDTSLHISLLDQFGKIDTSQINSLYSSYQDAFKKYQSLLALKDKLHEERDYLKHIIDEITELNLKRNEEAELVELRINLKDKNKILEIVEQNINDLNESVIPFLNKISKRSSKNNIFDESISEIDSIAIEAETLMSKFESISEKYSHDNRSIEEVEARLYHIRTIQRKYGSEDLDAVMMDAKSQLEKLDTFDLEESKKDYEIKQAKFISHAKELTKIRLNCAKQLEKIIMDSLQELKMSYAIFKVNIAECDPCFNGLDGVKFLIKTNPNSDFEVINKTASGGELSRIYLSLKVALSDKKSVVILDEIDTGVGGATADAIGKKLFALSHNNQVITITHQPQIASYAKHHIVVKRIDSNVKVSVLNNEEQITEIARMLSGSSISQEAIGAAKELIDSKV